MVVLFLLHLLQIFIDLQQVIESGSRIGRKIAVFGRSMDNAITIGRELGYITAPKETFVDTQALNRLASMK